MEEPEFEPHSQEQYAPPGWDEPICLISYEITTILLNGDPENRSSFWRAYRREFELNKKTDYRNYHVKLCAPQLRSLKIKVDSPVYYRGKKLATEKQVEPLA